MESHPGEGGKAKIEAEVTAGGGVLKCMKLDLDSLASVDALVARFIRNVPSSHLITGVEWNDANILPLPRLPVVVKISDILATNEVVYELPSCVHSRVNCVPEHVSA